MTHIKKAHLFLALLAIFGASVLLNLGCLEHFAPSMTGESEVTLRKIIIQVHTVLLAGLLGGLFARPTGTQRVRIVYAAPMLVTAILWALYIGTTWLPYPQSIGANGPNGLINQFNDRASQLSSVVAAAFAYISNKT